MAQSAFIRLVEGATTQTITLEEVKSQLERYVEMTQKTGAQLNWGYAEAAFPYTFEQKPEGEGKWFYLKGKNPDLYRYILFGIGQDENQTAYIQVTLPDDATHGDKAKANEFCRFLAKHYQAELVLFNGRVQHFNLAGKKR